jgi:hypothetical protein
VRIPWENIIIIGENDDDMRMFSAKTKEKGEYTTTTSPVCFFVWNNFEKDVHKSGLLMKNEGCPKGV